MNKPFWIFYLLCFLLLALVPILSFLPGMSMDFAAMGQRASEQTGIAWNSNLINVLRLSIVEPGLLLLVLGSSVPMLAALVVVLWFGSSSSWKQRLSRLLPVGESMPWRRGMANYLVLVIVMIIGLASIYKLRQVLGFEYRQGEFSINLLLPFAIIVSAFFDQGALLEEAGWRGFGTVHLQQFINPLKAALVIGLAWGLWHVPRDITIGLPGQLGFANYLGLYLPAFCLGTVSISIIAAYFMNRMGGSLLPAILVHGLANDAYGIAGQASIDVALTFEHQITSALPWAVFALLLVLAAGPQLGTAKTEP